VDILGLESWKGLGWTVDRTEIPTTKEVREVGGGKNEDRCDGGDGGGFSNKVSIIYTAQQSELTLPRNTFEELFDTVCFPGGRKTARRQMGFWDGESGLFGYSAKGAVRL
jgi:hypothetical protein